MPAIQSLMKRLGFVKLSSYGLVLTPEGRIISLRPAVLDDGLGGRIVGWKDNDLAAAELERWEPARPAAKAAVASRVAAPLPPRLPVTAAPAATGPVPAMPRYAMPAPVIVAPTVAPTCMKPAPAPAPAPAAEVAEPEEDWEWTIAVARARAAAEEAEQAAAAAAVPAAAPAPAAPRRMRADTVPPPVATKTQPMAIVAAAPVPAPVDEDGWPKTEPLGEIDHTDHTNPMAEVVRVVRMAETPRVKLAAKGTPAAPAPVVRAAPRPGTAPATVIPIPRLPSLASTPRMTHLEPVVRSSLPTPMMPAPPRRMAKGTGPITPRPVTAQPVPSDDTVPGIALPGLPAARPIPSIKRVTQG